MIFHGSKFYFLRQQCTKIRTKIACKMAWLNFAAKTLQDASKTHVRKIVNPFEKKQIHFSRHSRARCGGCRRQLDMLSQYPSSQLSLTVATFRCSLVSRTCHLLIFIINLPPLFVFFVLLSAIIGKWSLLTGRILSRFNSLCMRLSTCADLVWLRLVSELDWVGLDLVH